MIEHRAASAPHLPTGWPQVDRSLMGGLPRGAVHEWLGLESDRASRQWSPPLSVLLHLANQAAALAERETEPLMLCWIGARVWPSALSLMSSRHEMLARSLFVEAGDAASRIWAADLAARTPSVLTIVDGTGFDMAASRRLQLAAEASTTVTGSGRPTAGWLVHLTRPPWEAKELTAASTRWNVARSVTTGEEPRFEVRCLRAKGLRSVNTLDTTWVLERSDRDRLVVVSPGTGDRSRPQASAASTQHSDRPCTRRASA